jgi:hypothetical protein
MPYFQQQPAQPGNPLPFHSSPASASPGWTESETNSENDQGNKKTKTNPAKDEMIYNPDQWKGSPSNLSYGPVPRHKPITTPEEVQDGQGSRYPFKIGPEPRKPKPKPYPYLVNLLTFVQDIVDHPDMRDTYKINTPTKRGGSREVEAVSFGYMQGFTAGWDSADKAGGGPTQVPPGGTGEVAILLDTAARKGSVTYNILVGSDGADSPTLLAVRAFVLYPTEVVPEAIDFKQVARGQLPVARDAFLVAGNDFAPAVLGPASSTHEALQAELQPKGKGVWLLTVTLREGLPLGPFVESVAVVQGGSAGNTISVPVRGTIVERSM